MRYLTAGESHGPALTGIVEGLPAGVPVSEDAIHEQLRRRWLGFGRGGRAKIETDRAELRAGVRFGKTMGSPVALVIENAAFARDKAGWPEVMAVGGTGEGIDKVTLPRPGHADLVGADKYGFDDIRPVIERSSARETAMRVACGSLARQLLAALGVEVGSHVLRVGAVGAEPGEVDDLLAPLVAGGALAVSRVSDTSELRMLSPELTERALAHVREAKASGDSLGGVYEVVVTGLPAGLGSYVHWDRRLDGRLGQAILSIQAQKAVEIGDGIAAASLPGSRVHDEIVHHDSAREGSGSGDDAGRDAGHLHRASNRAGGLEGGMTTGMPLVVRGFMKPIPTLIRPLMTVDRASGEAAPTRYERSDVTSVPAAAVVAEAVVCWTLAEAILDRYGADRFDRIAEALARDRR